MFLALNVEKDASGGIFEELLWLHACSHRLCQKLLLYPNSVTIEASLTKWLLNENFSNIEQKI